MESLDELVKNHLKSQPYKIECSECHEELEVLKTDIDDDFDISVKVEPCEKCMRDAIDKFAIEML